MVPDSTFLSYVFWARVVLSLINVSMFLFLIRAFLNNRAQFGFLILAIAFGAALYTNSYFFLLTFQRQLDHQLFPTMIARLIDWTFYIANSVAMLCSLVGTIVLVRTYGRTNPQPIGDKSA